MRNFIKLLTLLFMFAGILFLTGCESYGGTRYSTTVYQGYGYPPSYGYGGCCYGDRDVDININRPNRPNHPNRPIRPDRPNVRPVARPMGGMGRPARGRGGRR